MIQLTLTLKYDYRTGCRNVSHCQQQQSYSELRSPGRSNWTYFGNDSWVKTFHNNSFDLRKFTKDEKTVIIIYNHFRKMMAKWPKIIINATWMLNKAIKECFMIRRCLSLSYMCFVLIRWAFRSRISGRWWSLWQPCWNVWLQREKGTLSTDFAHLRGWFPIILHCN